ncbi:HMG box-containing protein 1 [Frankliniella occidentalis]|uniref:HMG box-containing protein 1 n=1 Tax=Frankliniella occidentalis TaxID=133901 RepID=A0A6J1SNQ8_FRAOC|nr:HMG box-containing protein 1 [Frankliniella occidentalis]XP_026280960.1 HMG box-containing protein 1 [Frankliniella occidentalis]
MIIMASSATMMDLSCNQSTDSSVNSGEEDNCNISPTDLDFKPKDLSVKTNMKRPKLIPPPLNLRNNEQSEPLPVGISTTLKEFAILATGPQSPLMQKNLPFRKRAHSVPDAVDNGPLSAPATALQFFPSLFKQEHSPETSSPPLNLSLPPTPKAFPERETESPQDSTVVSSTLSEVASPLITSSSHPTSPHSSGLMEPQHLSSAHQQFARHHISPWSPFLPSPSMMSPHWFNGSPSALLSPAPSSLGSSQEDLRHAHSLPLSSVSSLMYESDPWRLPWPYPVWHCFQMGTLLKFSINSSEITLRAEEVHQCSELQFLTPERLGQLRVQRINPLETPISVVEITFSSGSPSVAGDFKLVATCYSYHTFLVVERGWCAVSPDIVLRQYGIQCQHLECGDSCPVPPKMPSVSSPGICEKFKRFSFSPEELGTSLPTPSSLVLSPPNTPTMKTQHPHQLSQQQPNQHISSQSSKGNKTSKQKGSQQTSDKTTAKAAKVPLDPDRPKRPMNAFMLFAKQHRLKLIRMHPGKDNRFVSVILGEAWRQLPADEKEVFISEAKALSHERKRLHPECWKRKRTQTTVGALKIEQSE